MDPHARAQFDLLLAIAASDFAERCVHRAGGPDTALALLRESPEAPQLARTAFVDAFFGENLLDTTAGCCFVLEALERQPLPADPGGPAAEVLSRLAHATFAEVVTRRAAQLIAQQQVYS